MKITIEESKVPITFELAHEIIKGLVINFQAKESYYLKSDYQEAETRKDFIDKFFIALGWDVNHDHQKNPYEQEVKVEPPVLVEGRNKRADYSFALAPNYREPRFYAEAKKPSVELKSPQNYFQTIRYAWNRATPLAVLTNFYEFHVLDCRYKPNLENSVDRAIDGYSFSYKDFLKEESFRRFYDLFSHEAVSSGSIEKISSDLRPPRGKAYQKGLFKGGYQKIDETILEELDEYRLVLAKAFKRTNSKLEGYALTEAVQRTIDRLVFIRFLEDKLIEEKDHVSNFGDGGSVWKDFVTTCRKLDPKYNGLIFHEHFIDGSDFHSPDENEFGDICENLAHVNSPYDFNAIPIDILGSIYERFLGKVIICTAKQVKVEEKPNVKKAGGVFYTPQYIVKYIVENTVGKLVENKNPDVIEKMTFGDISCGSGSFLLEVFDYLIRYHSQYYLQFPKQGKKDDFEIKDGVLKLTLKKKREILLNSIYGVDIDPQAVEVTQLSLYLKLLEDETFSTTKQITLEFKEALLPGLEKNIQCGNSLVGTDILKGQLFPTEEERQLNPFDFGFSFSKIMKSGGFDGIVGNPPYITYSLGRGRDKHLNYEVEYISQNYGNSSEYKINSFAVFYQKAVDLLKTNGKCALIVPGTILINGTLAKIRKFLLENTTLENVTSLNYKVWKDAEMGDCAIIFCSKIQSPEYQVNFVRYNDLDWENNVEKDRFSVKGPLSLDNYEIYGNKHSYEILKIGKKKGFTTFGKVAEFYNGIKSGDNKKYLSDEKTSSKHELAIRGRDFEKYGKPSPRTFVLFDPKLLWSNTNEDILRIKPKIIIRQTGDSIQATIDRNGLLCMDTVHMIYKSQYDFMFLVGLLNSKLLNFYHQVMVPEFGKAFAEIKIANLQRLPFPPIELNNTKDKSNYLEVIKLVKSVFDNKDKLEAAKTDNEKAYAERIIGSLINQIDDLVFKLYGLTDEELRIVETS